MAGMLQRLDAELRELGYVPGPPPVTIATADHRRAGATVCPRCGATGLKYYPYVLPGTYGPDFGGFGGYRQVLCCRDCAWAYEP